MSYNYTPEKLIVYRNGMPFDMVSLEDFNEAQYFDNLVACAWE